MKLAVPSGPGGHGPGVNLRYEGGRGNGPLGFGWALDTAYVQRQSDKGIPRYVDAANQVDDDGDGLVDEVDEVDRFVQEAGEELIPADSGDFFPRNETEFARYRRVPGHCVQSAGRQCVADSQCSDGDSCSGFHWTATVPNGTVLVFGETPQARVTDPETGHVFRWLLERSIDTNGNTVRYSYRAFPGDQNLNQRYLSKIEYGPGAQPWDAFHFLSFEYEERSDWFEDARSGFLCRTGMRLKEVVVGTSSSEVVVSARGGGGTGGTPITPGGTGSGGADGGGGGTGKMPIPPQSGGNGGGSGGMGVPPVPAHLAGDFNSDGKGDFLDRKYVLAYDPDQPWSVLASVTQIGADGTTALPPLRLEYTRATLPDTISAAAEVIGSTGEPEQVMDGGAVDLADLNGDGLPDLLETDPGGTRHTAYVNLGESVAESGERRVQWAAGATVEGDQRAWSYDLKRTAGTVAHLADMDGDGLADFVYQVPVGVGGDTYYFRNQGNLTWGERVAMNVDPALSDPPPVYGAADVKTADVDFDKRIDIIQSIDVGSGAYYRVWRNLGNGQYAPSQTESLEDGFLFSDKRVQFADLNGDRLSDIVRLRTTGVQVLPALGYGRFAARVEVRLPDWTLDDQQADRARLEDVDGDGLSDFVLLPPGSGELWYWLNLGNYSFDHRRVITGIPAAQGVHAETRWADMNGNGTTDLVIADSESSPRLRTVDIGRLIGAAPSPRLLSLVDNGLGRRTRIDYLTSVAYQLAAAAVGNAWATSGPFPVDVVSRVTVRPGLELDGIDGEDAYVTDFAYRDAYYDGPQKEFRGFSFVKQIDRGDETAPTQVTRIWFHDGGADGVDNDGDGLVDERNGDDAEEEPLKGRILRQEITTENSLLTTEGTESTEGDSGCSPCPLCPLWFNGCLAVGSNDAQPAPSETVYNTTTNHWAIRRIYAPGGGTRGATVDGREVSFAFSTRTETQVTERNNGEAQTIRTSMAYDDFGNETYRGEEGALSRSDDQRFTWTEYAPPDVDRWIIDKPVSTVVRAENTEAAVPVSMSSFYYDGPDFVGLPLGQVEKGNLVREEAMVADGTFVNKSRKKYDQFGNVVGIMDPLGDPARGGAAGHLDEVEYDDALHAFPVKETIHVGGGKAPLSMTATYDIGFGVMTGSVDFNGNPSSYGYDLFGRLTSITKPGDSVELPTQLFTYHMSDPSRGLITDYDRDGNAITRSVVSPSYVATHKREVAGQAGTFDVRQYVDGMGRKLGTVEEGETGFVVKEAVRFNARGTARDAYQPFAAVGEGYDLSPAGAFSTAIYDATGREVERINPPERPDCGASCRSSVLTIYKPLTKTVLDENRHEMTYLTDGLKPLDEKGERLVEVQEVNGAERWITRYEYNPVDSLTKITDSQANVTVFNFDGLQRKTFLNHPDRGVMSYAYDAASNLIATVDAKAQRIEYAYDGVNRLVSEDYLDAANRTPDVQYRYDTPQGAVDTGHGSRTPRNTRGFLVSVNDLSGAEQTSYDERGRVEWTVKQVPDPVTNVPVSYATDLTYDSLDRVVDLTYPDGDRITYEYNKRSLLTRITGGPSGSIIQSVAYQPSGQQAQIEYGNSVNTTYQYDPRLRLTDLHTVGPLAPGGGEGQGEGSFLHYVYTFDPASNITRIDDKRPANQPSPDSPRNTQIFSYDDLYRLTRVQYSFALPGEGDRDDGHIDYAYDRIGNMLSQTSNIDHLDDRTGRSVTNHGTMLYGGAADHTGRTGRTGRNPGDPAGPHALTAIQGGAVGYDYDDNGNMTTLDGMTLTWDFKDRLVAVENDKMRAEYSYDYTDRRITKKVTNKPTQLSPQSSALSTVYVDKHFEVREHDQPVKYVWNGETRVAQIRGTLDSGAHRLQRIRLKTAATGPGWNLISLAVDAPDAAEQLGIGTNPAILQAYRWNKDTRSYDPLTGSDPLPPGSILWIQAAQPLMLTVEGAYTDPVPPALDPQGGYVAVPGLSAISLDQANPGATVAGWVYNPAWPNLADTPSAWLPHFGSSAPAVLQQVSQAEEFVGPGEAFYVDAPGGEVVDLGNGAYDLRYYHQDHLGSTNVFSNVSGQLVEEAAFYPFGQLRANRERGPRNDRLKSAFVFTQKELDEESQLYYFEARHLSGALSRFATVDPIASTSTAGLRRSPQRLSSYAYGNNSPIVTIDPNGEVGIIAGLAIGVGVGTVVGAVTGAAKAYLNKEDVWQGAKAGAVGGFVTSTIIGAAVAGALVGLPAATPFVYQALLSTGAATVAGGPGAVVGSVAESAILGKNLTADDITRTYKVGTFSGALGGVCGVATAGSAALGGSSVVAAAFGGETMSAAGSFVLEMQGEMPSTKSGSQKAIVPSKYTEEAPSW